MERLAKLKVPHLSQAMGQLFPLLGLITVIKQTMPPGGHEALHYCRRALRSLLDPFCFYTINEFEGHLPNDLYQDIHLHLESCKAYSKAKRVSLFRQAKSPNITMRLADSSDVVVDTYKGMTVWWSHQEDTYEFAYGSGGGSSTRKFQLRIRKRDKARLMPEYLDFITRNSSAYSGKTREIKIYTNTQERHQYRTSGSRRMWKELPCRHPSTFDTLALDPCLKEKIVADLTSFTTDQAFYERSGRAWKRGYLLYGPPGTGKSSMIAAMANFLKYDIYDLELSQVRTNGDLRQLLIQTTNRSIIVLEDIDCSVKFTSSRNRKNPATMMMPGDVTNPDDDPNRVTLSGLLNFVDGLWSCCGDERLFVFTTNHVEKLDKALLRPGRMDMQIELSYCTFPAFRVLAQNYLSIEDHLLFEKLEAAFLGKTLTPAQVAELLIKDKSNVDVALESVINALENNVPEPAEGNSSENVSSPDALKNDIPGMDSMNVTKGNLIEVLEGAVEVLEKSTELGSLSYSPSGQSEGASSSVQDIVRSLKSTIFRNAAEGELESAIEGVVQALATKLPLSDIQHIFNVEPTDDQRVAHSASAAGSLLSRRAANGSSSKAVLRGVHKEMGNGKLKESV